MLFTPLQVCKKSAQHKLLQNWLLLYLQYIYILIIPDFFPTVTNFTSCILVHTCVCYVLYWYTGSKKKNDTVNWEDLCSTYAAVDHLNWCPKLCESVHEEFTVQSINSFQVIGDKQNNISWYKTTEWVNCQQLPKQHDCRSVPATFVVRSGFD